MRPPGAEKGRIRWPIIMVAMGQFTGTLVITTVYHEAVSPPDDLLDWLVIGGSLLLVVSSVALVVPQPWAWRTALAAQVPILGLELVALFFTVSYFSHPHPEDSLGMGAMVCAVASLIAFPLALCSLTALLQLLRPRTRLAYGVPVGK